MSLFLISPSCCGGLLRYKKGSWEAAQILLNMHLVIISLHPMIQYWSFYMLILGRGMASCRHNQRRQKALFRSIFYLRRKFEIYNEDTKEIQNWESENQFPKKTPNIPWFPTKKDQLILNYQNSCQVLLCEQNSVSSAEIWYIKQAGNKRVDLSNKCGITLQLKCHLAEFKRDNLTNFKRANLASFKRDNHANFKRATTVLESSSTCGMSFFKKFCRSSWKTIDILKGVPLTSACSTCQREKV
jgi:hypothetical protein